MELLLTIAAVTLIGIWAYQTNKVTKQALAKAESEARYWKGCCELYRITGRNPSVVITDGIKEDDFIVEAYENYIDKLFNSKIKK